MKLFHYTSVALAESILSSSISPGHLMHSDGGMLKSVVWLTAEPRSWGHGLATGDETPSPLEIAHSERVRGEPLRNNRTADKTCIRIAVELDPGSVEQWNSKPAVPIRPCFLCSRQTCSRLRTDRRQGRSMRPSEPPGLPRVEDEETDAGEASVPAVPSSTIHRRRRTTRMESFRSRASYVALPSHRSSSLENLPD